MSHLPVPSSGIPDVHPSVLCGAGNQTHVLVVVQTTLGCLSHFLRYLVGTLHFLHKLVLLFGVKS